MSNNQYGRDQYGKYVYWESNGGKKVNVKYLTGPYKNQHTGVVPGQGREFYAGHNAKRSVERSSVSSNSSSFKSALTGIASKFGR